VEHFAGGTGADDGIDDDDAPALPEERQENGCVGGFDRGDASAIDDASDDEPDAVVARGRQSEPDDGRARAAPAHDPPARSKRSVRK
jgi:hypothetical protein